METRAGWTKMATSTSSARSFSLGEGTGTHSFRAEVQIRTLGSLSFLVLLIPISRGFVVVSLRFPIQINTSWVQNQSLVLPGRGFVVVSTLL